MTKIYIDSDGVCTPANISFSLKAISNYIEGKLPGARGAISKDTGPLPRGGRVPNVIPGHGDVGQWFIPVDMHDRDLLSMLDQDTREQTCQRVAEWIVLAIARLERDHGSEVDTIFIGFKQHSDSDTFSHLAVVYASVTLKLSDMPGRSRRWQAAIRPAKIQPLMIGLLLAALMIFTSCGGGGLIGLDPAPVPGAPHADSNGDGFPDYLDSPTWQQKLAPGHIWYAWQYDFYKRPLFSQYNPDTHYLQLIVSSGKNGQAKLYQARPRTDL